MRQTFQDPERVAAGLVEEIRRGTQPSDALADRLRQAPQEFGTLRGERSLLGRDDAARTSALDALPRVIAEFRIDMRTLNPTLLRDAIREGVQVRALQTIPTHEQRLVIHRIYTRKIKEF